MEENTVLIAVLYLAGGFVGAFYGYRLLRLLVALAGFAVAVGGVLFFADLLFVDTNTDRLIDLAQTLDELTAESAIVGVLVTLFAGFIGAVVFSAFYRVGIALLGGVGAAYITFALLQSYADVTDDGLLAAVLFAFFLGAIFSLRIERRVIVLATALLGAFFMLVGGLGLLDANDISTTRPFGDTEIDLTNGIVLLVIWLLLAIFGAYRQFDDAELRYDYL